MDHGSVENVQLLDFLRIREKLGAKHKPSLAEFEQMLRTQAFGEFMRTLPLSREDRAFALKDLPKSLRRLRLKRKSGEHDIGLIRNMKDVASLFREFMGIGCGGILPRLVEIGVGVSKRR